MRRQYATPETRAIRLLRSHYKPWGIRLTGASALLGHPPLGGLRPSPFTATDTDINNPAKAGCSTVDPLVLHPPFMWKHPHLLNDFDYIGMHHYSITWCCVDRELLFTQRDRVDLVREQILRACQKSEFEVIA